MIEFVVWTLMVYSLGVSIAAIPLKMFVNKYYPERSNLNRSFAAYGLAVRWPGIVVYGIVKAIRPPKPNS